MKSRRILVVEDDPIIANDLTYMLRELGHRVLGPAHTLSEGIECAGMTSPDLALLDIHLEEADDGIKMAAWLKTHKAVPIIFLTAYADELTISKAGEVHPDHYLVKPFREDSLKATIEIACSNFYHPDVEQQVHTKIQKFNATLTDSLSKRELELLKFVNEGMSNRDLADKLCVSENTIKTHLQHIYSKAGVNSRSELIGALNNH